MTHDDLRAALLRLAKLTDISITGIDYMARLIAQADRDPLPLERWAAPFEFSNRIKIIDDDFLTINAEVPEPDAQVDLQTAHQEWLSDIGKVAEIYESGAQLTLTQHWRIFLNGWDWFRFWSERHPNPVARAQFAQSAREYDIAAQRFREKAAARIQPQRNE